MSAFLRNAQQIFEVARQSGDPEDFTIHLNDASYRVQRGQGRVSVEARLGGQRCVIETAGAARLPIVDQVRYLVA